MSDNEFMVNLDEEFNKFVESVEKRIAKGGQSTSRSSSTYQFEPIKWVGLEKKKPKVIRIRGTGVPGSNYTPYTPVIVRLAKIKADNGKFIKVVLPADDTKYILWEIINKVKEFKYNFKTKTKVYPVKERFPEIYDLINTNGSLTPGSKKYFGLETQGWAGREYIIFNCIDRTPEIYEWSKQNKHTVLLARNISVYQVPGGEEIEFVEEGLPSFSFLPAASNLIRYYGNWENYDIVIERTGIVNPPLRVLHAVQHAREYICPQGVKPSEGPLTPEEESWEMYDLAKLYKPTSASKLLFNLKRTIKEIDSALKTNFLEKLEMLAEKEKEERMSFDDLKKEDEEKEKQKQSFVIGKPVEEPKQTIPTSQVRKPSSTERTSSKDSLIKNIKLDPPTIRNLLKLENLEEKDLKNIVSVKLIKTKEEAESIGYPYGEFEIVYNSNSDKLSCFECRNISPAEFSSCPVCGVKFE